LVGSRRRSIATAIVLTWKLWIHTWLRFWYISLHSAHVPRQTIISCGLPWTNHIEKTAVL